MSYFSVSDIKQMLSKGHVSLLYHLYYYYRLTGSHPETILKLLKLSG